MASDGPKRVFAGEMPEPPTGTPFEVARAAWKMAWRAERLAIHADNHGAALFEQLGGLARQFSLEQTRRFDEVTASIIRLNERFDELEKHLRPQLEEAMRNAREARTSSSDLSEEVEKMEDALGKIKDKAIDSMRVRQIALEAHQVIVTKERLEELEKRERDAADFKKTRDAERRNYKLTVRGLIVSGIIVTLVGIVATHFFEKATSPATVVAPATSH